MKIRILTTTLFLIILTGCDKQPEQAASEQSDNPTITAQFEQSDEKIGKYLDQLDDPNTPQDVRIQILCKDYPTEYKKNYMPALLKLSPTEYWLYFTIKKDDTSILVETFLPKHLKLNIFPLIL